jgi:hypothetical protein
MRYSILLPALAAFGSTFARPKQPEFTNTTILPTHFGLVVFPHYQALDIFGPMDLLNTLFMYYQNSTIVPKFSVLSKTMDPVTSAMMTGGFGQEIMPTTTFSDYLASREQSADNHMAVVKSKRQSHDGMHLPPATDKGDIDVLIVPGGGGTRRNMTEEINFVKQTYPKVSNISVPFPFSSTNNATAQIYSLRLHRRNNPIPRGYTRRPQSNNKQGGLGMGCKTGSQCNLGSHCTLGRRRQHYLDQRCLGRH